MTRSTHTSSFNRIARQCPDRCFRHPVLLGRERQSLIAGSD